MKGLFDLNLLHLIRVKRSIMLLQKNTGRGFLKMVRLDWYLSEPLVKAVRCLLVRKNE